jgi:hypothetical protein
MPVTIKINGTVNSLVHKMSNGMSAATIPDVCKTPSPGGPVPIPYPNIAQSVTLADGTTSVKGDKMMAAIKGSKFALSNGDNAGVAGGVKSSTFMKEATWILYSFDVKLNKKNACRLSDKMFHNAENAANLAGEFQGPAHVTDAIGQDVADAICASICDARDKANRGELPNDQHRTLQSYVASRHSSGFPLYTPSRCDMLVESTWRLPSQAGGAFSSVLSSTGRMMSNSRLAPASLLAGLAAGRGAPGTTFRPDFAIMKDATKAARWNNLKAFVDVKFKGDQLTDNQIKAKKLAGKSKFKVIEEEDCNC